MHIRINIPGVAISTNTSAIYDIAFAIIAKRGNGSPAERKSIIERIPVRYRDHCFDSFADGVHLSTLFSKWMQLDRFKSL